MAAVRQSLSANIATVLRLVNDQGAATWSVVDVQAALDGRRQWVNHDLMRSRPHETATGVQYLDFTHGLTHWDSDVVIRDRGGNVVTPDTSDITSAKWTFTTQPDYPLYITGYTYCVYGAAVDLLAQYQAGQTGNFDFTADGGSYKRSQIGANVATLITQYQRRARPKMARLVRSDLNV